MELTSTQGFKNTEIGDIPMDWDLVKVVDLIDLLTDYDANGSFASVAENVKVYDFEKYAWYVRSTDLENDSDLSEVRYVDRESYNFLKKTSLYGGELLFLKRGDIGNVYLFEMKTKYATVAPNLYLLKLNDVSNSTYLYYYFKSNKGQKQLKSKNASSTLGALYKDDVKSIYVPIPPTLKEQKSIATALTDLDELITGLEKLISKKKDIKRGAMQQLLTPPHKGGRRLPGFSGEWEKKQLKSCLIYEQPSKYIVQNSDYEGQSQTPVLTAGKSFLLGYTDEDFGIYDNLPVIIFDDFTTSSQFVNFNFKVKSSAMKMLKPVDNCVDIKFIFSLMNLINFSLGDEHKRRWIAEYSEQIIYVPKIDEQRAISSMIDDMTFELDELISKRKKYQAIKQGMMQELLTGKTRLV